jgi:hypothetical protein
VVLTRKLAPVLATATINEPRLITRVLATATINEPRLITRVLATATINDPRLIARGPLPNADIAHLPARRLDQHRLGAVFQTTHPRWRRNLHPERAATCKPRQ